VRIRESNRTYKLAHLKVGIFVEGFIVFEIRCNALCVQCVAVCCSVLQCVAGCQREPDTRRRVGEEGVLQFS